MAAPKRRPSTRSLTRDELSLSRAARGGYGRPCRRALKLPQEQIAAAFYIPIGTIRDWEQGRYQPDAAARAYLRVIAREPNIVRRALAAPRKSSLPRA